MIYDGIKEGKYIILRPVEISDATFTSKLRGDAELCKYIHKVDSTMEGQKDFIRNQREQKGDLYFVIESASGNPIGTIALYHINCKNGEIGRWVSYGNAFQNLEAVILLHDLAFDNLGIEEVYSCTNVINERIINFWRHFGSDGVFIEEQYDFTASKNIIKYNTYKKEIRPRITKVLRYDEVEERNEQHKNRSEF